MTGAGRAVAAFAAVNLVAVPLAGRLAWMAMEGLVASGQKFAGVLVSLLATAVILGVNVMLCRWAEQAGLGRPGLMALWAVTGLTFVLTIGTGFFSPLNLVAALLR